MNAEIIRSKVKHGACIQEYQQPIQLCQDTRIISYRIYPLVWHTRREVGSHSQTGQASTITLAVGA
jgi:hypothetical protein